MAIDGQRSSFPEELDDLGNLHVNDACERFYAEDWNLTQDALYQLERHTLGILQSGDATYTHTASGSARPKHLVKTYTVAATGSGVALQTVWLPAFTAQEKSLFGGTPLASGVSIQLWPRLRLQTNNLRTYHAAPTPITDPTGDTGWEVQIARQRSRGDDLDSDVPAGTYVLTLLLST